MPGLSLYTSNRSEILIESLAEVLTSPPLPPLQKDVIVVQSKGMEKWVRMELAKIVGISANLDFPFPNAMIHRIFSEILPTLPEDSPYDPQIMTWVVMKRLASLAAEKGFEGVQSYLGGESKSLKLYQISERIADLFDQYLMFRPDMILRWERGHENHWQARLWRRLARDRKGPHRAKLRQDLLEVIRKGDVPWDRLPERIAFFGISSLPPFHMEILAAVSKRIQVNLFVMNPCREYWADIVSDHEIGKARRRYAQVEDVIGTYHLEKGNSLLASLGSLGKDFLTLVSGMPFQEHELYVDPVPEGLLSFVQHDILHLEEPGISPAPKRIISRKDESIQIHSCHSPLREIEVLFDGLLALFEKDPDLKPKDILVMAPEIETYAPFIEAVFGTIEDEETRIPFSISDRSVRFEGNLLRAFFGALDLSGKRFGAQEVLALLEHPAIGKKFGLAEADLAWLEHWIRETGIRWGMDSHHREELGLPPFEENTWRMGLDRLLLGYALPGGKKRLFKGLLPYDQVEGSESLVLGKWVEFVERLFSAVTSLSIPRTLERWARFLNDFLEDFFSWDDETEFEGQMLREQFRDLHRFGSLAEFDQEVALEVIRNHLEHRLEKRGFGFGFLSGGVTFCSMLPMRSIPFKVICLLGMNGEDYPRQGRKVDFDLMAKHPRVGDRSRRNDDRYLFLEAILSARKVLYVSYVGQSIQDNTRIPPSPVVSELIDYLEQGFTLQEGNLTTHLITEHRLQGFSPSYFEGHKKLFSYSRENFLAASSLVGRKEAPGSLIREQLPTSTQDFGSLDLGDLARFFANPVKFLLRERLGIHIGKSFGRLEEQEPFVMEGLERYRVEQTLFEGWLEGTNLREILETLKGSGALPPGEVGLCVYEQLRREVGTFARKVRLRIQGKPLQSLEVSVLLGPFKLSGKISRIYPDGLLHYRCAKLRAKDHLAFWIQHLMINGFAPPAYPRQSLLLGRDRQWRYLSVENGEEILRTMLEDFRAGMGRPLHFFPETSLIYAHAVIQKNKTEPEALDEARIRWHGTEFHRGEAQDPYYRLCFGKSDPLDQEFQDLALEIFAPLLEARRKLP